MNMNKDLIIVCTEKHKNHALLLETLIMTKIKEIDENGNEILKNAFNKTLNINNAIWTDKQYRDSLSTIRSDNKILFIGNFKESNDLKKNINCNTEFDKFGIYYGYSGNKAIIYVKDPLNLFKNIFDKNHNDEFNKIYKELVDEANKVINHPDVYDYDIKKEVKDNPYARVVLSLLSLGTSEGVYKQQDFHERQYSFAVLSFFKNMIEEFLEK